MRIAGALLLPRGVLPFLITLLSINLSLAKDNLAEFNGMWGFKGPSDKAGQKVMFSDSGLVKHAYMPDPLGSVSITESGRADSDFVMSGSVSNLKFDCYYELTVFAVGKSMGWHLKDGDRLCWDSVLLEKSETPASNISSEPMRIASGSAGGFMLPGVMVAEAENSFLGKKKCKYQRFVDSVSVTSTLDQNEIISANSKIKVSKKLMENCTFAPGPWAENCPTSNYKEMKGCKSGDVADTFLYEANAKGTAKSGGIVLVADLTSPSIGSECDLYLKCVGGAGVRFSGNETSGRLVGKLMFYSLDAAADEAWTHEAEVK